MRRLALLRGGRDCGDGGRSSTTHILCLPTLRTPLSTTYRACALNHFSRGAAEADVATPIPTEGELAPSGTSGSPALNSVLSNFPSSRLNRLATSTCTLAVYCPTPDACSFSYIISEAQKESFVWGDTFHAILILFLQLREPCARRSRLGVPALPCTHPTLVSARLGRARSTHSTHPQTRLAAYTGQWCRDVSTV